MPRESQTFRADIEELLPFVSSGPILPRPLGVTMVAPERPAPARPEPSRRNWASIAIFAAMLVASALPLWRYAGRDDAASQAAAVRAAALDPVAAPPVPLSAPIAPIVTPVPVAEPVATQASETDAAFEATLARIEASLPEDPVAAADLLLLEGLKALQTGQDGLAETLLGRALKRDEDNPRAHFALARIRLKQGNVEGAEGWALTALRKRPRRAEYHALYATILDRLGRPAEAEQARQRAAELTATRAEQAGDSAAVGTSEPAAPSSAPADAVAPL